MGKPSELTQKYVATTADRRLDRLDKNMTEAINSVLVQKGWSRQDLSRKAGISHSTLSAIMVGGERTWNLAHLMRIAVALGVKLSDIILAAEHKDDMSIMLIAVAGTAPQTRERLDKIIGCVAPEGTTADMMAMFYTADMMEAVASSYVADYLAGKIADQDVYSTLSEVASSLESGENLWVKFASLVAERGNALTP
jgi:DNA-binding Xre family transcriptional regulator